MHWTSHGVLLGAGMAHRSMVVKIPWDRVDIPGGGEVFQDESLIGLSRPLKHPEVCVFGSNTSPPTVRYTWTPETHLHPHLDH